MNEKEKAHELFSQMYRILFHTNADPIHAKQCAIVTVEELFLNTDDFDLHTKAYWNEVKEEIEKI